MTHPRQTIREAVVAALLDTSGGSYPTTAEDRVYANRIRTFAAAELPAIRVFARSESIARTGYPASGEDGVAERVLLLTVECIDEALETLDASLDTMAEDVEAALEWLEVAGLESATLRLVRSEYELDLAAATPVGYGRLVFDVRYRSVWRTLTDDTPVPTQPMAGWAPDIGTGHEDDYVPIADDERNPPQE